MVNSGLKLNLIFSFFLFFLLLPSDRMRVRTLSSFINTNRREKKSESGKYQ